MKLTHINLINSLWIILIALTLFSAYMAEQATPGLDSVAIMALVLAIKGRIIVNYFMELKDSHVYRAASTSILVRHENNAIVILSS